jgi:hypothetical protein
LAPQFGLSSNTVLAIGLHYLQRWSESRKKPGRRGDRNMGVDEIYLGKKQKFSEAVQSSASIILRVENPSRRTVEVGGSHERRPPDRMRKVHGSQNLALLRHMVINAI